MTTAKAHEAVRLARRMADVVPLPPGGAQPDPACFAAWEKVMVEAADGLAKCLGYDSDALDLAVGPALEVGVNPPWRVLLLMAQAVAGARRGTRVSVRLMQAIPAFG